VFEIPTNITEFAVYGAAALATSNPLQWEGSNIAAHCTVELAETHRRITVPMTFGPRQIIWLTVPGTH